MVRLLTNVASDETLEAAEARLTGALETMEGFLPKYIPG